MQKTKPYEKLAIIYDQLMNHVNYKRWAKYIVDLFQYTNVNVKLLIDISCGTGTLLTYLNKKKFTTFGSDLSFTMVNQAKNKIYHNNFMVNDVKNNAISSNKFDAVIFLYDSLNYLQNENQVNIFFREVNRILVNDGIFIFDMITDFLCRTHYRNFEEEENWDHNGYIRHSYYDEFNQVQHNDFRIKIGNDIFLEHHTQKVFSEEEIEKTLTDNGFEVVARLDDFTFHSSDYDSERIHYVCVKKVQKND